MSRIDFHSHIIWGVDDGSKNVEMSMDMLSIAQEERVEYICATPHFIIDEQEIKREDYDRRLHLLKEAYEGSVKVISGLELYMNPKLPEYYKMGFIFGINYGSYMLVELPMRDFPLYTRDIFYELSILGIKPILAHPERNLKIQKNPELLKELIEDGVIAQMNAGSIMGAYGEGAKITAKKFVESNMIHIVGSDGHNNTTRKPMIKNAYDEINKLNPILYNWIKTNSINIINDKPVKVLEINEGKKSKGLFQKLFKKGL